MFALFTDFGHNGPYVGQLHMVLRRDAPKTPAVDLMHDVPAFDARSGAYLLAALADEFPAETVFVAVVDPGVGGERRALALQTDRHWFVGPDNGLLCIAARHAQTTDWFQINWQPQGLSRTFHGRDLFAPVAAQLARGEQSALQPAAPPSIGNHWPDDLPEVIYCDRYGNATTGLQADGIEPDCLLKAGRKTFRPVQTFGEGQANEPIWYRNSNGLVELAINQGNAAEKCKLMVGSEIQLANPPD